MTWIATLARALCLGRRFAMPFSECHARESSFRRDWASESVSPIPHPWAQRTCERVLQSATHTIRHNIRGCAPKCQYWHRSLCHHCVQWRCPARSLQTPQHGDVRHRKSPWTPPSALPTSVFPPESAATAPADFFCRSCRSNDWFQSLERSMLR